MFDKSGVSSRQCFDVCLFSLLSPNLSGMTLINPDEYKNAAGESGSSAQIRVKEPKRVLHFSDGVLEEYSDEEVEPPKEEALVDPATLTWGPWFWYKTWRAGAGTLSVIDTMGEFLAAFLGITTPKYYFELEEYKRRQKEMEQDKEQRRGWSEPAAGEGVQLKEINTRQPQATPV